ncbi:cell cycle checkpoint control protein family isoform X2 [Tasmannia lanceolata]|uniref:cell cycle checkpoint control protein family isoform X2 n=1 Tax=Tasmannia lanceolata TaxID=3420 RepID=UPI00406418AB
MEFSLSGNALKTFNRSITCLARIGNELVIQASSSQLVFHSLNSSRSAYQCITFKADFFDAYTLSAVQVQCSVLLKAVCSILRTPITSVDRLIVLLPNSDAAKVQWTLDCHNGTRKAYWISCNVEPDIQHLSLDRRKFPSNFVVRPRDLNRLFANFQSSLQEITIIATEPTSLPSDTEGAIGGKAVELRSYIDPTKENSDTALHTQLWIDPVEEFVQYTHTGDAVDITFSVKELKAFLSFCEGCEVDIHLFFEKAGEPILLAPKFGMDDGTNSDFDTTVVLATMLISQLRERNTTEHPPPVPVPSGQAVHGAGSQAQCAPHTHDRPRVANPSPVLEHPSDHTRIWSELSGSAAKSSSVVEERNAQPDQSPIAGEGNDMQRLNMREISNTLPTRENVPDPYPDTSLLAEISWWSELGAT